MMTALQSPELASAAAEESCREVPFDVSSEASEVLRAVPVTGGLCLPKGSVHDAAEWLVEGLNGAHHPAQTEILNRWSDGSVRWLLVSFVASRLPPGCTTCTLVQAPAVRRQPTAVETSLANGCVSVRSNEGRAGRSSELVLVPELCVAGDQSEVVELNDLVCETSGCLRHVYLVRGAVRKHPSIELQLRIEAWPSTGAVKAEVRLRNSQRAQHRGGLWDLGDAGSYHFESLNLHIKHNRASSDTVPACVRWRAETDADFRECSADDGVRIVQYGSGSAAWANTTHIDHQGRTTVRDRGYVAHSPAGRLSGHRSEPLVSLMTGTDRLSVAVPEFWQQFPGSVEVQEDTVTVGLFPKISVTPYELQGGEQKTLTVWAGTAGVDDGESDLSWAYSPVRMFPTPRWVRQCRVIPWLPDSETLEHNGERYHSYIQQATSGRADFDQRRETIDEYGWRNYGDLPADHEQTHYNGSNTVVSHYNNQFDLIFGGIQNLLTSRDARWFRLFEPLARHVMDIDIYHTDEDRACFNGGMFWHTDHYVDARTATHRTYSAANAAGRDAYGGGPSNEHNYTTGLLYYYFLTGSREAHESVVSLADWVIEMDDGTRTIWGLLDSQDTGLASQTVFEDFHGPGRGVGNSINALLDAWILTDQGCYIRKAEQLIRRAVHPNQDCDALHLADAEGHWSYTVCLTALGRYLAVKLERHEQDETYEYVRQTLAHYGRWMAAHEKPSLSEPDQLEYPTEAWAAQDFRKANVLRIAASCVDDPTEEAVMRSRADELNDAAWRDLYQFGDRHLTARCLSILMTEGLRDVFHRSCCPEYMPAGFQRAAWEDWTMFVPQKQRVRQVLKNPVQAVMAATRALNPLRIARAIDAFRRHL